MAQNFSQLDVKKCHIRICTQLLYTYIMRNVWIYDSPVHLLMGSQLNRTWWDIQILRCQLM